MRIRRIRLRNLRGIDRFEARLAESGVTVIEGPNESGKTSVAQAIDLAFEYLDSSGHKSIKALKPVHRDAGTEVELELTTGPYRLVYRKRWHRSPSTTLTVAVPRPEQLTGREAHERMRAILEETLDVALWKALQVQQGVGDEQAAPGESRSLLAALDRAAADRDALDQGDGTLWQRVVAERERYWTSTGRPSAERKRLQDELEAADAQAARLTGEMAALDDAAERHRTTSEQRAGLREELAVRRAVRDEHAEAWAEVDRRRRAVAEVLRVEELARRDAQDADRRQEERRAAGAAAQRAAESAARLAGALAPAEQAAAAAACSRDAARLRQEQARAARRAAEAGHEEARAAVEHHRLLADHASLQLRLEEVERAEAAIRAANGVLSAGPVTSADDVRALEEARFEVATAEAALRASAPTVSVEALREAEVVVDGQPVRLAAGTSADRVATGALAIELPGILRVLVTAGAELSALERRLAAAREAFARRCERSGHPVEGAIEAARDRAAACAAAERDRDRAEARLGSALAGSSAPVLRDLLADRAVRIEAGGRSDGDEGATDEASAARRLSEAAAAARSARDDEQGCAAELGPLDEHARDRAAELREATVRAELAAEQAAEEARRLAALRQGVGDAALAEEAERLRGAAADAAHRLDVARAAVAALDPDRARLLLDNVEAVIAGLEAEDAALRTEQIRLSAQLEARGEDALQERLNEALAERERLHAASAALERRAAAAARLHDALASRRQQAKAALVAPFREQVESLGRVVFGPDLRVELDDDLRVVSRTLGGVTVQWDGLSTGAREQFGVITRLACAAIVAPGGEGVPVVLDDVFGHADDGRLAGMGAVLALAGRVGQVIVLTCSPARFRGVGGATVLHMADLLQGDDAGVPVDDAPDQAVLACLSGAAEPLSKSEILELTGLDQDSWGPVIGGLVGRGAVQQLGQTRGSRYRIAS